MRGCVVDAVVLGMVLSTTPLSGRPDYPLPTHAVPLPRSQIRSEMKRRQAGKYKAKVAAKQSHKAHLAANPMPRSSVEEVFRGGRGDDDDEDDEDDE